MANRRGSGFNRQKFQDATIQKAIIVSNSTGKKVDMRECVNMEYSESIYDDTIRVGFEVSNVAGTIDDKTLLEGLPLVGTEDFELTIIDGDGNKINVNLIVNNVTVVTKDNQKENLLLSLVSEEVIRNESEVNAVRIRHDGKISNSIKDIFKNNLQTEKQLFVETTSNNFNFVGNKRKPMYMINWLSKKSIPMQNGKQGETAGYLFFETSLGYYYQSIDTLFAQDQKKSYGFFGQADTPVGYDGNIINLEVDNRFEAESKLRSGTYNTKLILFDPFNCKYDEINEGAKNEGTTNAGIGLPIINKKFNKTPTRTTFMLRDTGVLPTGDVGEQLKKNHEEIFEVAKILNQAIRRYSQFSIGAVQIDIFGDFSLHAGDIVFIDSPSTEQGDEVTTDKLIGGKYLIASVKHVIRAGQCQTRLGLVRDSIGRKGKPHSGSMVN